MVQREVLAIFEGKRKGAKSPKPDEANGNLMKLTILLLHCHCMTFIHKKLVSIIICISVLLIFLEKKRKTRSNADHFKQVRCECDLTLDHLFILFVRDFAKLFSLC